MSVALTSRDVAWTMLAEYTQKQKTHKNTPVTLFRHSHETHCKVRVYGGCSEKNISDGGPFFHSRRRMQARQTQLDTHEHRDPNAMSPCRHDRHDRHDREFVQALSRGNPVPGASHAKSARPAFVNITCTTTCTHYSLPRLFRLLPRVGPRSVFIYPASPSRFRPLP